MRRIAPIVALLVACNGDDDGTLPADTDGAGDACGEAAPVVESLTFTDEGLTDPEIDDACGADAVPLLKVAARATDADGDLHDWSMRLAWDTTVDNDVDTSGDYIDVYGQIGLACGVFTADVATILCLSGEPPYSTEVEWAVIVTDDEGHDSNVMIDTFSTPAADGSR